jgi:hypothetical protein
MGFQIGKGQFICFFNLLREDRGEKKSERNSKRRNSHREEWFCDKIRKKG